MVSAIHMPISAGMKATLLWTNNNPYGSFEKQNIVMDDFSVYDYLVVVTKETTSGYNQYYSFIKIDKTTLIPGTSNYALQPIVSQYIENYNWTNTGRKVYASSDFTLLTINESNTIGMNDVQNWRNIPLRIYGLKGKINGLE